VLLDRGARDAKAIELGACCGARQLLSASRLDWRDPLNRVPLSSGLRCRLRPGPRTSPRVSAIWRLVETRPNCETLCF
jgi:xanthine/CO dehydrogenase XdhC/CoxF family maturation factor